MICLDCRRRISEQEEKTLDREVQVVWASIHTGEWVCDATGNEHVPGDIRDWLPQGLCRPSVYACEDVLETAQRAVQAAGGDSNDEEIEALQDALATALAALGMKPPEEYEVHEV